VRPLQFKGFARVDRAESGPSDQARAAGMAMDAEEPTPAERRAALLGADTVAYLTELARSRRVRE
jgi:hypothetical protein